MRALWTVYRLADARLPFRVAIELDGRTLFAVRAASSWPGPGEQVFCLREDGSEADQPTELIERVPILQHTRLGRKLTIVLDRPMRKRREFLVVRKPYRNRPGTYEQLFFRTESGIRSHRSRSRLEVRPTASTLDIVIDSAEKYAWRFPGARIVTRKLPAGDYALLDGERIAAVVERKSFDNLVGDLGAIQALHHALVDLSRYEHSAVVVEAQYADFLDERRLAHRWPPSFVARALAEVAALHPGLPMVFAGNRKLANDWTHRFFTACAADVESVQLEFPVESPERRAVKERAPSRDEHIREVVRESGTDAFSITSVVEQVEHASESVVRRVLKEMEREGKVRCLGRGRGPRWVRVMDR